MLAGSGNPLPLTLASLRTAICSEEEEELSSGVPLCCVGALGVVVGGGAGGGVNISISEGRDAEDDDDAVVSCRFHRT